MEKGRRPSVLVFNPFAEGYIAHGKAFAPTKHQAMLAEDLANLPQFLCQPDDIVLLARRPSMDFLNALSQAGFLPPQFVELKEGRIDPASDLCGRTLGSLRPWAWGPDSVELLEPLFAQVSGETRIASQYFNKDIARLYSKAGSADFLRKVLAGGGAGQGVRPQSREGRSAAVPAAARPKATGPGNSEPSRSLLPLRLRQPRSAARWLCSEEEAGVVVDTLDDALGAIAAIRRSGHSRVVVKQAYGAAGHNAMRFWEPELLPAQRRWLAHSLRDGGQLVVEPWLERELDFSVQLEMGLRGLVLCGYTGLVNDLKGQFLANWAEPDYSRSLPARVAALLTGSAGILPASLGGSKHAGKDAGAPSAGALPGFYREVFSLLEAELREIRFVGPISIDAFVYRAPQGGCRLKPVVEINPRYTMGRLTLELMKHACPGSCGWFRLVTRSQARAEGFSDLDAYADASAKRFPLRLESDPGETSPEPAGGDARAPRAGESYPKIRQGFLCLNEPAQAKVCLATFEVSPMLSCYQPSTINYQLQSD